MRCCGGWMSAWMGTWMFFLSLGFVGLLILSGVLVWALSKREARNTPRRPAAEGLASAARPDVRADADHEEFGERGRPPESHRSGVD